MGMRKVNLQCKDAIKELLINLRNDEIHQLLLHGNKDSIVLP